MGLNPMLRGVKRPSDFVSFGGFDMYMS